MNSELVATATLSCAAGTTRWRSSAGLAKAVEAVFRSPRSVDTPERLVARAGIPERTVYRALDKAGFATPWTILRAARVLRGYHYLRTTERRIYEVAAKLGYEKPDTFAAEVRAITGLSASHMGKIDSQQFVAHIAASIRKARGSGSSDGGVGAVSQ
jgi:methylphosphotriester-DNA--protein-cysteine methyltransferase